MRDLRLEINIQELRLETNVCEILRSQDSDYEEYYPQRFDAL
jgi:hypothetical protein